MTTCFKWKKIYYEQGKSRNCFYFAFSFSSSTHIRGDTYLFRPQKLHRYT